MSIHLPGRRARTAAVGLSVAALVLTACSTTESGTDEAATSTGAEASAPAGPRLAVATDNGVAVLDAESLEEVGRADLDGFVRLNDGGDGEHVYVSTSQGFEVLGTGASTGAEPALTGAVFEAGAAGHVVLHEGRTVLFDDATGSFRAFDTDALTDSAELPAGVEEMTSPHAHHGVAIELSDGTVLATIGTEESRSGVRHLDADGTELARSEDCPGVHGEGSLAQERVIFGCEDGVLLFDDGEFTTLDSPDEFGRVGNAYVTEGSDVAVVDYNDDPDAEGVLLHRMAVVNTTGATMEVVDLPDGVEYTWQGVERAEDGSAWFVGTDGSLHQVDGATGEILTSHPVIEPWEGPAEWQDAHPYLVVADGTGWVTEPGTGSVHAVDLATGAVTGTGTVDGAPNEMTLVS